MIAILSYGLGNVRAFANIYEEAGIAHMIADRPEQLRDADRIILPGVGAFDYAMQRLHASGMTEALTEQVLEHGKPVLGVCVGMQMLASSSEEGNEPGLGWISGRVEKIRFPAQANLTLLPHMGWNTVARRSEEPLLTGLDDALGFYFLHSYAFACDDTEHAIAHADYGGRFVCAVRKGNICGVQFHPEKSHRNGIALLHNFANL